MEGREPALHSQAAQVAVGWGGNEAVFCSRFLISSGKFHSRQFSKRRRSDECAQVKRERLPGSPWVPAKV